MTNPKTSPTSSHSSHHLIKGLSDECSHGMVENEGCFPPRLARLPAGTPLPQLTPKGAQHGAALLSVMTGGWGDEGTLRSPRGGKIIPARPFSCLFDAAYFLHPGSCGWAVHLGPPLRFF